MTETTEQKRARIVAEVAKARLLQLEAEEQNQNNVTSSSKQLTVDQVLGVTNPNNKYNHTKVTYEMAAHQKEFGARKFIKP